MVSFTEINLQFKVQCYKMSTKAESYRFWSVSEPQSHSKFIVSTPLLLHSFDTANLVFTPFRIIWLDEPIPVNNTAYTQVASSLFLFCLFFLSYQNHEYWIWIICPVFFFFKLTTTPDCSNCNIWHTWLFHTEDMFLNPAELICIYSIACCTLTDKFGLSLYQVDDVWVIVCSD